jgi:argininosuccinate lyase
MAAMLRHTTVNQAACAAASADPALLATDLADYLVRKGVPFRKAHYLVGRLVARAEQEAKPLDEWDATELQAVDKHFGPDAPQVFDLREAMAKRNAVGAPGTSALRAQLARWRKTLHLGQQTK